MMVSTKGRYALRLMIDLAQNGQEGNTSLKEIAKRQELSIKYLEQIVGALGKEELLVSSRGSKGGYRLMREPQDYTVGEILRAAEGSLSPVACLEGKENACPRKGECLSLDFWQGLYRVIEEYCDSYTLADLLASH